MQPLANIVNKSGIHPVGQTLLILPKAVEEKTKGGIIISTATETDRLEMAQMYATVVEVSALAWSDVLDKEGQPVQLVKEGDDIIFSKYAGHLFEGADGLQYRLISDLDVKAKVDKIED